ncbi:MAG: Ig-like domain-containing protein, partial [Candidatus Bipolaricaulota bacterium]|nr:Ig-like domain-containing protein [Candidatus Bipolaricaulota bacterium]
MFEIDTRKPEVGPGVSAVAVDTDLVYESDLIQVVIVTFDETMRSDATAEPVITFSAGTWTAGAAGVWSAGDTVWTRTYTLTDNDEEVAGVTVDVTGARDAAGNGQENYAAVPEFTIDTLQPRIVRIDAEGRASCGGFYCSGESDTVVISVTFSEDVVLAAGTFNVTLDVLPGGFDVVYVPAGFLPPEAYPACWNDYTTRQGYVVAAGHNSCDLESTAADWSVGTLTDAAGNLAITGLPPVGSRIKALRDIIVDTTPPQAVEDPGASVAYTYVQPAYLAWHEFVEDRERIVAREGVPIYIDVLTNDLDNCHAGLSVATAEVPAPTYGVTSLFTDGGTGHYPVLPGPCDAKVVRYAPAADYTGPDEFGYTARDCSGNTSDGMVYLYVFPKSTLGSVVPNAFSGVPQSVELSVRDDLLLRISDPGQFTYRFGIPDATEHGVLAWTDGDVVYDVSLGVARLYVTYTSAVAYEGGERFTWSVTDPFEVTEERVESFSVVRPDMTLAPLAPSLRVASAGTGYLVVPAALMEEGGVAAIRVQILG